VNPTALIILAMLSGTPAEALDARLYRGEWEQVLGELRKQLAATDGAPARGRGSVPRCCWPGRR
jgi:hypothetical protein